jgi:hypothetical protein
MLCSPLKVNQRFGGTYRLYLQSRKISQARKQPSAGSKQNLKMEAACPSDTSVDFSTGLHGVISYDGRTGDLTDWTVSEYVQFWSK